MRADGDTNLILVSIYYSVLKTRMVLGGHLSAMIPEDQKLTRPKFLCPLESEAT